MQITKKCGPSTLITNMFTFFQNKEIKFTFSSSFVAAKQPTKCWLQCTWARIGPSKENRHFKKASCYSWWHTEEGTCCQDKECYRTSSLLSTRTWIVCEEGRKWSSMEGASKLRGTIFETKFSYILLSHTTFIIFSICLYFLGRIR